MLSYAFKELNSDCVKNIDTESFSNIKELMAEIIINAVTYQLKKGLLHEYNEASDELSVIRGKLNILSSINYGSLINRKVVCDYDEYTEDTTFNQILKSTTLILIKEDIRVKQKTALKKLLLFFGHVSEINLRQVRWTALNYNRKNSEYRLLLNICRLIAENMIHTTDDGIVKLMNFNEKTMSRLYEKFILNYFIKNYPHLSPKSKEIKWNTASEIGNYLLPKMQSDIMLTDGNKTLIIDAKYYTKALAKSQFGNKNTYHSNNLYQIFTYVKNEDKLCTNRVFGMLLYAKTDEDCFSPAEFNMNGNMVYIDNLDLGVDFSEIENQFKTIIERVF